MRGRILVSARASLGAAVLALALGSLEPASAGSLISPLPPLPPPRPVQAAPAPPSDPPGSPDARAEKDGDEAAGCLKRLAELGARFAPAADRAERACAAKNVVLLSGLPGPIEIAPASPMVCAMAEALAKWSAEVVVPKAAEHLQEPPGRIQIGTSYECRNQRSGGKLSEHAFGNAVDLMGLRFAKRAALTIGSHAEESAEARFQDEIRRGACAYFTTVLGPGSDAAHGDHLHLDLRARKRGYRICQ